jgi:RecB family endonuclease NucS
VPLFEMTRENLAECEPVTFAHLEIKERADLQHVLHDHIEVLDSDLRVIAEEYGNWEDSRRRIDLLALDKQQRLVVIELKRTETGGHMDLQALRYAAMVSAMTLSR